jgi:hypothetical protein
MAKSKGRSSFGRGSSGRSSFGRRGTVTVIEDHVSRSYARSAKIAFWVISVVVGLLAATVASSYMHPILALLAGAVIGVAVALPIAAVIAVWPVLRVLWWWTPEISLAAGVVFGFILLAQHTPLWVRITVVMLLAAPAAFPLVRTNVMKVAYCFISRHRIRTCFAEFIIGNNKASLPFILWARITPVGESVWIWLRPGLALEDLNSRLDQIAVACWASLVTVERASASNAAYVRINIKRRDALTGTVVSNLMDEIDTGTLPPTNLAPIGDGSGLDIFDVTEASVTDPPKTALRTGGPTGNGKKPAREPVSVPADDTSDWI